MHERKRNRLLGFDYRTGGAYFVTICVRNRACVFGEIVDGVVMVNEIGRIVQEQWDWLGQQYPYIRLDAFVIMPNHVHGIVRIDDMGAGVGTGRDLSLRSLRSPMHIKSLSGLIGAFKTTSSKRIHRETHFGAFAWQRSFHDRIIRDEREYHLIAQYIADNPARWVEDRFFMA